MTDSPVRATIAPQPTTGAAPAQPGNAPASSTADRATFISNNGGKTQGAVIPAGSHTAQPQQRPAWLPEKFKSPEDMAAAYAALEQRLGQAPPASPAPAPAPAVTPDAVDQTLQVPDAPQPAPQTQAAQAVMSRLMEAYTQHGQIPQELRAEFTKTTGLPDTLIDNQVAFMRERERSAIAAATERLGGESAVGELIGWASQHLSQAEREAFNRTVYSPDPAIAQLALDGLAARYEASVGSSPKLVAGRKPMAEYGGLQPFQSSAEWTAARRDPRYKADPAFRAEVEKRLAIGVKMGLL